MEAGNPVLDGRSRSRQIACLAPIHDSYRNHDVIVRGVHYLYYLTAAACHSVHIIEVAEELPHILAEGREFEAALRAYTQIPELFQVYRPCRSSRPRSRKHRAGNRVNGGPSPMIYPAFNSRLESGQGQIVAAKE